MDIPNCPFPRSLRSLYVVKDTILCAQEEQILADLLESEVAAFEAECDAFATTFNLDKLNLESGEISEKLAVCHASSANSADKIQLHKQHAEGLQQQARQLTKLLEEANEELNGERTPSPHCYVAIQTQLGVLAKS